MTVDKKRGAYYNDFAKEVRIMLPNVTVFGLEIDMYNTMYAVGFVGMFLICFFSRKKYKVSLPRCIIYSAATMLFGVLGAKLMSVIYVASMTKVSHGEYTPKGGVCIFGALMFLPVFLYIFSVLSGEKFRKLADYMAPGIFLILACAKFGCLLGGCCYGIASETGVHNHNLDYRVFPVQLYESICTFIVAAVLVIITAKRGKVRYGALYPAGAVMYCCARFFWENYRYYEHECEREFFLGMTFWQCWAVLAIILSVVWLVVLYTNKKFAECPLEVRKFSVVMERLSEKESKANDKKRKKHADKAKEHADKAKELRKNNK